MCISRMVLSSTDFKRKKLMLRGSTVDKLFPSYKKGDGKVIHLSSVGPESMLMSHEIGIGKFPDAAQVLEVLLSKSW